LKLTAQHEARVKRPSLDALGRRAGDRRDRVLPPVMRTEYPHPHLARSRGPPAAFGRQACRRPGWRRRHYGICHFVNVMGTAELPMATGTCALKLTSSLRA
jgi:hypothetical protein